MKKSDGELAAVMANHSSCVAWPERARAAPVSLVGGSSLIRLQTENLNARLSAPVRGGGHVSKVLAQFFRARATASWHGQLQ
jgi:hypothetical protein